VERKRHLALAAICLLAYTGFFYWAVRGDAEALLLTTWGISPFVLLFGVAVFVRERASRWLLVLSLVLTVVGVLLLLNARLQGYDLVPLFLPLHQMEVALVALLITAILAVRGKFTRVR